MKIKIIVNVIVLMVSIKLGISQENKAYWFKISDKLAYVDETPYCWFYFTIQGDTIMNSPEQESIFITNNGEVIQIFKKELTQSQNRKKFNSKKEKKILKWYKNYELNYQQDEVFSQKLDNTQEFFINKNGKNFLLWDYKIPEIEKNILEDDFIETYTPIIDLTFSHNTNLTFISNSYLITIVVSTPENELQQKRDFCKELANNIYIYGVGLHPDELSKRENVIINKKFYVSDDSLSNLKIEVPEWMILQQYPNFKTYPYYIVLFASYPDSCNIVNAIAVTKDEKNEFSSFDEFNKYAVDKGNFLQVTDSDIENIHGGISKKVISQSSRGGIFYNHLYTIETNKSYVRILFTATEETYNYNITRHEKFLKMIKLE